MEQTLKRQILQAAEAVKKKVKKMRNLETDNKKIFESVFEPITSPLNEMLDKNKKSSTLGEANAQNDILSRNEIKHQNETNPKRSFDLTMCADEYENEFDHFGDENSNEGDMNESFVSTSSNSNRDTSSWSLSSEVLEDIPYGIRKQGSKLYLGLSPVIMNSDNIIVDTKKYKRTPGLTELLLKKDPDLRLLTDEDMNNYKIMLRDTNAHRRDFDPNKPIKSNKGRKYLQIIKPFFLKSTTNKSDMVHGKGLPLLKQVKNDTNYIYWDDPNELVERLKLLVASRNAGNTGLDNEIMSIIEELRESGVITHINKVSL